MKVAGKIALITGGARGLGKGFAKALLDEGASVCIADMNAELGIKTASEFQKEYGPAACLFIQCNVGKKEDMEYTFRKTKDVFGHIDIVVNNAGIVDEINWERTIDIDLTAVIRGSFLAVDYMHKDRGGRGGLLINISSTAGLTAVGFEPVYSAAKHGVVGISRSLADNVGADTSSHGVRIACLCPSFTKTDMMGGVDENLSDKPEDVAAMATSVIGITGMMEVSDVVNGFMKIVEDDRLHGAIVAVSPRGVNVKFPRELKGKL